jgi:hypothetical protein
MKKAGVVMSFLMFLLFVNPGLRSQDNDRAKLAKAVAEAKVSLEQGLSASAQVGKPISAKFEVEDGELQLSVYTDKGDTFAEVVVDPSTGKVARTEPTTSGEDFTAAKAQSEVMSKTKQSLHATLAKVLKGNPGFRAVSIIPTIKAGHPIAEVTLTKGDEWKTISEKLE